MLSTVVLAAFSFNGLAPATRTSGITMAAKKAAPAAVGSLGLMGADVETKGLWDCLLYTSPSPRD